jgi:hypothetical protein
MLQVSTVKECVDLQFVVITGHHVNVPRSLLQAAKLDYGLSADMTGMAMKLPVGACKFSSPILTQLYVH